MPRPNRLPNPAEAESFRIAMEQKKAVFDSMKLAYFHRSSFAGTVPDEEAVKNAAKIFIDANYRYQKILYGRVRVKLSTANLLR